MFKLSNFTNKSDLEQSNTFFFNKFWYDSCKNWFKPAKPNTMKTLNPKWSILTVLIVPFLYACPKAKSPVPAEPDTEVQSAIDASYATFLISDIEMVCGFVGDGDLTPDFYLNTPETNNTVIAVSPSPDILVTNFNNIQCLDGMKREGSIFLDRSNTNPNARYYRNYEFHGRITLSEFKVNGWLIKTVDGIPCHIYNQLSSPTYDPSKTKLSWTIEGSFEFIHPTDPSKNMLWKGKLTKTLTNTADPAVFHPSRQQPVNWTLAQVEYSGNATGYTASNVPFTLEINAQQALTRDFTCFADQIGGVTSAQPIRTWNKEFHPFKTGVASFTTGNKYPRQIYYGNEGNPELALQCDNSGEVLIKGSSYRVDFMK